MMTTHFFRFPRQILPLLAVSLFVFSCSDDDTPFVEIPPLPSGYFIVNEGGFGNANTSISFYDRTNDTIFNNVFETANGRPLGDQTQSMTVVGNRGFIVVQNSAKVEVINTSDFTSIATITEGIVSPRYFISADASKAYLTDWGADGVTGTVKVIDLTTYEVIKTIPVGEGPNQLLQVNDRAYVANGGGFGHDSTVMVLDTQTDTVVDTITVGDNPSSLVFDANGNIWVAGGGLLRYDNNDSVVEEESTPGFIAQLESNGVRTKLEAAQVDVGPSDLVVDPGGNNLYFRYAGGVYTITPEATDLPSQPLINRSFYGLGIDPISGEILVGEALTFSTDDTFYRYTSTGELIKSYTVGIAPNGFAF